MQNVYFAAFADIDKDGGIYRYVNKNGKLEKLSFYPLDKPMYLALDESKTKMWILLQKPFADSDKSALISADVATDGSLSNFTEPVSTDGVCACHLSVLDGRIYAANYMSGSLSMFDGNKLSLLVTHSGRGPHPTRQTSPHTHFIRPTPDNKYLFAVDLGLDTIFTYTKNMELVSKASVPSGYGCRHLDYSPDGKIVYCVNELVSSVTVFDYSDGILTANETFMGIPDSFTEKNTAAAIRVSPDGRKLYISNRGHDSICRFDVDGKKLSNPQWIPAGGSSPRDFIINDDCLYITNEKTNNVTFISLNGSEAFAPISMPNPLCVIVR